MIILRMDSIIIYLYQVVIYSRYAHLFLDIIQYIGYFNLRLSALQKQVQSTCIPERDITVISATLGEEEGYAVTLQSWLKCNPRAINIVTLEKALPRMKDLLEGIIKDDRVRLHAVERADIRLQLLKGISETFTKFVVLVDDDSRWSTETLNRLALAFQDPCVGGVNTMQYVRSRLGHRNSKGLTVWESYGALNLIRRNILHSAVAYFHSGQVLNLSGRTVAYRTEILQDEAFKHEFVNDYWKGKYLLRTGDDSFITSWIVNRGWNTAFMNQPDAVIITTVNDDITYLNQVTRWSRDTARHYLRDLVAALRTRNYYLYVRSVLNWVCNYTTDFLVLWELGFLIVVSGLEWWNITNTTQLGMTSMGQLCAQHFVISSSFTIFEHAPFFMEWSHLKHMPGTIGYMYIHAFIVGYAWCTLHKTVWGSRSGVDDHKWRVD
ncbi:conserved hypothetical protein [Talaromyces stipitatus ATCC 10500]|uniref:Polysaccharide synthase Cps1 n=1 Tax=Talaromyces stipitatus (strain ATCC 10500 / CBS 375.48 / QM 6759 / NRRL 1006) TaxID=441959 RepID=B8ME93_TALSN|nr:uncharacterized protein TSTA_016000 [Talaromyces stipitatus ATCC 10500]EED16520.1 conserved hypothetical protein [Talaromyces stipitatus ATCC 10500]